ncbi:MAG: tetratricopeptide repeat protein, partial [Candidatus Omnitrophota bacterium]
MAFFLTAAAPQAAQAQEHEGRWNSGKQLSAEELTKNVAELELAVKQNPADIELYIRLGFTYSKLGKADDAQKAFESAVRLNPKRV